MVAPAVDVVIATYGRPELTLEAVESVRQQTYGNWRLYVVDDRSDAESLHALRDGLAGDERTTLIALAENVGAQGARQRAVPRLNGDVVAMLDSDDVWAPQKLERQVALLDDTTDLVLCLHRWIKMGTKEVVKDPLPLREPVGLLGANNMSTPLIRRRLLELAGGFRPPHTPRLCTVDNLEFHLRLLGLARRVRVAQELLVDCRMHPGERASDALGSGGAAEELAAVLHLHADLLARHPREHAQLQARLASRYAAAGRRLMAVEHLRAAFRLAPAQSPRLLRAYGPHLARCLVSASG